MTATDHQAPTTRRATASTASPQASSATNEPTPSAERDPAVADWRGIAYQPLAHFTMCPDGTLIENHTGDAFQLRTPSGEPVNAVDVRIEHLDGDTDATETTITAEAEAAVYGDRHDDYGHPREDFTRAAIIWTGLLGPKLADGHYLEPEDVARCMIGVKLARDVHAPKRDNRVDMAGYALTLDRLETGQ